ncbi:ribonuclease P protein component [Flavobacteriaceae bacterium PRS1]|mgnify:CR=1 FL=1|jgi:ribonuclease P protein component|nr:ribonuclease P protein component [Flavobacteriaceae bacterium PRS1]
MDYTFKKLEKLKSKKKIEQLFLEGSSVTAFPLRLMYLQTSFKYGANIKISVSVSKRNFKKAVDRNRIKRLMRETYRLNKNSYFNNITTQYALMILYIGTDKPKFKTLETKMKLLFEQFLNKVS